MLAFSAEEKLSNIDRRCLVDLEGLQRVAVAPIREILTSDDIAKSAKPLDVLGLSTAASKHSAVSERTSYLILCTNVSIVTSSYVLYINVQEGYVNILK